MANNEETQTAPTAADMEFFGMLVTANVNAANHTTNLLLANREQEVREWQNRFDMLYRSMRKVYERTDSATARDTLDRFQTFFEVDAEQITY